MSVRHRRTRAIVVALVVVGVPPVMLAGAWSMAGASALEDDLVYYLPQRAFFGNAVRAGELPFWNPHVALGYAAAADPQSGTWYPATYLFALFDVAFAYPLTICLHFALAGWGMYRFLRGRQQQWLAALLGAVAFEFCGFLVAHRAHLTMHHAAAWVPVILWRWDRFARAPAPWRFALAVLCLAAQLLVQHIQVSIMTGALLAAYVAFAGRSRLRLVGPGLAAGVMLAGGMAAVQILPTALLLPHVTRSVPLYERFTENSFEWSSLALWVFPFLYGTRTPNFYEHAWWGASHLCEQAAYASLPVLFLATASLAIWKRNADVRFWSLTGLACFALALGDRNPVTALLFKVPGLDVLRVPARWLLGVNVALVVLATTGLHALLTRTDASTRMRTALARGVRLGIPAVLIVSFGLMAWARWWHRSDASAYGKALAASISPTNPAVLIPLAMLVATAVVLGRLSRHRTEANGSTRGEPTHPRARRLRVAGILIVLTVIDLASFAAFNDVAVGAYASNPLRELPLADWIASQHDPDRGERLWIPRERADYQRPLEVAWPMTNLLCGIDTLQAYTPLVRTGQRRLLGFKPWGASETALTLLRNPGLLQALSVRWVAGRTPQERALLSAAGGPDDATGWDSIGTSAVKAYVEPGPGVIWPVLIERPGIHGVAFMATPADTSGAGRWFVVLETANGERIVPELVFEPIDVPPAGRRMRCYFRCEEAVGPARVRVYTYRGRPLRVSTAVFGRAAAITEPASRYAPRWESPDGVAVHEVLDSRPRAYLVDAVVPVSSAHAALDRLLADSADQGLPDRAFVEAYPHAGSHLGGGTVKCIKHSLNRLDLAVQVEENRHGFLVVANTFDPGWTATVDGQPATLYRTNRVIQGLHVPGGLHRVTLRYRPPGLTVGIVISLSSLAIALALLLLGPGRGRIRTGRIDRTAPMRAGS